MNWIRWYRIFLFSIHWTETGVLTLVVNISLIWREFITFLSNFVVFLRKIASLYFTDFALKKFYPREIGFGCAGCIA
jgi:hypothetical protein